MKRNKQTKYPYQIIVTFTFEHEFTESEVDKGEPLPHEVIKAKVIELLEAKEYDVEEHER